MQELAKQLHEEAVELLAMLGLKTSNERVRRLFESTGLAYYSDGRILIEPKLVERAINLTPSLGAFVRDYGVGLRAFGGGGTAPYVRDGDGIRNPTDDDVVRIMRMAEEHHIPFMFRGVGPRHTPEEDVKQIRIMRNNYGGLIYVYVGSPEGIEAVNNAWFYDNRIVTCHSHIYSPLQINDNGNNVEVFFDCAERGLPLFLTVMPISYATGPNTIYGLALQAHAECLCGLVMAQLICPGITVVPSAFPCFADPKIEYNISFGSVSHQLCNLLVANVYGYLGLPRNQDGCSAGHYPGDDTYDDTRRNLGIWNAAKGWHQCRHSFGFEQGQNVWSFEKAYRDIALMDDVYWKDYKVYVEPPEYDPEALDTIYDVCYTKGWDFFRHHPHTLKHSTPTR